CLARFMISLVALGLLWATPCLDSRVRYGGKPGVRYVTQCRNVRPVLSARRGAAFCRFARKGKQDGQRAGMRCMPARWLGRAWWGLVGSDRARIRPPG